MGPPLSIFKSFKIGTNPLLNGKMGVSLLRESPRLQLQWCTRSVHGMGYRAYKALEIIHSTTHPAQQHKSNAIYRIRSVY